MSSLSLSPTLRAELAALASGGYPYESCGVLIGQRAAERTAVTELTHARNRNSERAADRFDLDPEDLMRADRRAREAGLEIVGIWHTHPDHPACPSETDRQNAWPDWSYLIVSVNDGVAGEVRSWRLNCEHFVEEELEP